MRSTLLFATCSVALGLALAACPTPVTLPDAGPAGFDAGNPPAAQACSGGCSGSQRCNTSLHICEDGCGGACGDGGTCMKVDPEHFQCQPTVSSCSGNVCQAGQVACLHGACTCISSANGSDDSCRRAGEWCHGTACKNPGPLEECQPNGPSCADGYVCSAVFSETMFTCVKDCSFSANACDRGDTCYNGTCLPLGLFSNQECNQNPRLADGGLQLDTDGGVRRVTVEAGNTCLLKTQAGVITDQPGKGTGNCTYAFFRFWSFGNYVIDTCRPPGLATEGQACKAGYAPNTEATQCATGLECVVTGTNDTGVCLRMCNANPPRPGFTPQPACGTAESCVNVYRYTDTNDNAVLGVCMKSCNVFDATSSACADIGTTKASCVPSSPDGQQVLSTTGDGICAPQQKTISPVGQTCGETDPFHGAACGAGQICTAGADTTTPPTCTAICDLGCVATDGGAVPARCGTEANATCAGGKTCTRISSTGSALVGICK